MPSDEEKKQRVGPDAEIRDLIRGMATTMTEGFADVGHRFAKLEHRQDDFEEWRARTSDRVRNVAAQTSSADLSNEKRIADEVVKRQELETKVDALGTTAKALNVKQDQQLAILGRLDAVAKNPIVKEIARYVGAAILFWLASKGLK